MYKLVPRQKPVGAPQINFPAYRKASSTERKNFLFDRSDSNDLINGVLKPSHVILSKTTSAGLSQSFQYAFPYTCLSKQNPLVVPGTNH